MRGSVRFALFALLAVTACERAKPTPPPEPTGAAKSKEANYADTDMNHAEIVRGEDGHFHVTARVNDADVAFLVDTGASVVALKQADADRVGLYRLDDAFTEKVQTPNGTTLVAPVTIKRVEIGDIAVDNVPAVILRDYDGPSLLGQSFLSTVDKVSIDKDVMSLDQRR